MLHHTDSIVLTVLGGLQPDTEIIVILLSDSDKSFLALLDKNLV